MKKTIIAISLILFAFATFAHAEDTEETVFFVQSAKNGEFDASTGILVLKDVSPTMIWFTNRPKHLAGHETVQEFVGTWGKGKDSLPPIRPMPPCRSFREIMCWTPSWCCPTPGSKAMI